jgi:hypothetical protein
VPDRGMVLALRPMSQINSSRPARLGFPAGCWGSRDGLRHGRSLWRPPWENPAYLARSPRPRVAPVPNLTTPGSPLPPTAVPSVAYRADPAGAASSAWHWIVPRLCCGTTYGRQVIATRSADEPVDKAVDNFVDRAGDMTRLAAPTGHVGRLARAKMLPALVETGWACFT